MAGKNRTTVLRQIERLYRDGTLAGLGDGQLLERYITLGDEAAFEALVDLHGPMVLGVCRRILQESSDVDDAFQATFLILVRKASAIRDRALLSNWLYGVAYRVAKRARANALRRRSRENMANHPESSVTPPPVISTQIGPELDQELNRLPERYRAPLVLCYLRSRTHEQAAEELCCPVGTVRSRLARGRDLLRDRLTRRGCAPLAAIIGNRISLPPEAVVPSLVTATARAVLGAGSLKVFPAGAATTTALALSQGVLMTMRIAQWKWLGMAILATSLSAGGVVAVTHASGRNSNGANAAEALVGAEDSNNSQQKASADSDVQSSREFNDAVEKKIETKIDQLLKDIGFFPSDGSLGGPAGDGSVAAKVLERKLGPLMGQSASAAKPSTSLPSNDSLSTIPVSEPKAEDSLQTQADRMKQLRDERDVLQVKQDAILDRLTRLEQRMKSGIRGSIPPTPTRKDTAPGLKPRGAVLSAAVEPAEARPGEYVLFKVTAKLDPGTRIFGYSGYSTKQGPGPIHTSFDFFDTAGLTIDSDWLPSHLVKRSQDPNFPEVQSVEFHDDDVTWSIRLKIPSELEPGNKSLRCQARYMVCNEKNCSVPGQWTLPAAVLTVSGTGRLTKSIEQFPGTRVQPDTSVPPPPAKNFYYYPRNAGVDTRVPVRGDIAAAGRTDGSYRRPSGAVNPPLVELQIEFEQALEQYNHALSAAAKKEPGGNEVVLADNARRLVFAATRLEGLDEEFANELARLKLEMKRKSAEMDREKAKEEVAASVTARNTRLNERKPGMVEEQSVAQAVAELKVAQAEVAIKQVEIAEVALLVQQFSRGREGVSKLIKLAEPAKKFVRSRER